MLRPNSSFLQNWGLFRLRNFVETIQTSGDILYYLLYFFSSQSYVLPDTSKKSYQKTRVIKRDTNPVFNHTIVYDGFHTEDLKDACVELTVWDHEKLTNHFLGGIRLGLGTGK